MIFKLQSTNSLNNLHGGNGSVDIKYALNKEDGVKGLDMFAEVIIDVGASIGFHHHHLDNEAYYIIEGIGKFIENRNEETIVKKGELCLITKGEGHGIVNIGEVPLRLIAVVWN